jgi:hypothetical protein
MFLFSVQETFRLEVGHTILVFIFFKRNLYKLRHKFFIHQIFARHINRENFKS